MIYIGDKMAKWSLVFFGFILTVVVQSFFAAYEFIGMLIVGFLVGYLANSGVLDGMWNATLAGTFGTIVCAILFVILSTIGGSLIGIFGGLTGFTVSGVSSIITVIGELIYYAIVMGIAGAVGGALSSHKNKEGSK